MSSDVIVRAHTGEDGQAIATPSPTPAPTPAPAQNPKNFLAQTWQKIFPPKKSPAPAATPTSTTPAPSDNAPAAGEPGAPRYSITVKTDAGNEQVITGDSSSSSSPTPVPPPAQPAPTPIALTPREGLPARLWHTVFRRKPAPPAATTPAWIGTIKLVNYQAKYALIDSEMYSSVTPGAVLNAVGNDAETGSLRVSNDRNPPFFIADIVNGRPAVGDRVYSPKP